MSGIVDAEPGNNSKEKDYIQDEENLDHDVNAEQNNTDPTQESVESANQIDGDINENRNDSKDKKENTIVDDSPKIAEDFFYDFAELATKPRLIGDDNNFHSNFLKIRHALGYNCQKRANLHVLDAENVAFAAGSFVQFYNLKTKQQHFLQTLSSSGVGTIAVHHSQPYIAIGEKGKSPVVAIYEWPSLKLWRILREGTEEAFSHLCFNPDGDILAALGSEPDYMLTLYDWKQEKILLRAKAHGQDVYRASFSQELQGQLTTSGSGHIKFWKMADTFTGLKLQGVLGRFGKTEISDIEGYIELPDGKVLSGCEWGNMLLWDDGLIKLEVIRKGKKSCHNAAVEQILLVEGEILTIGLDGFIRVWDLETIDTADVSAENPFIEMEPMNELKAVVSGTQASHNDAPAALHGIVRSADPNFWFGQDKNGAVWKLDLSFTHTSAAPQRIFSTHSGDVPSMATSPNSHLVVSAGADGTVRLHDFATGAPLGLSRFPTAATAILWAPKSIDEHCRLIVAGFSDGVVRLLVAQPPTISGNKGSGPAAELALKAAFKPHSSAVTALAFDSSTKIMATASADSTVFFFSTEGDFEPIGFIGVPGPVNFIHFNVEKENRALVRLLASCENGIVAEVTPPIDPKAVDHATTYKLKVEEARITRYLKVKSIKSRLRHEEELERIRIAMEKAYKKLCAERQEMAARGLIPEGEPVDPPEPEMPPDEWEEYVPDEPCPILFAFYSKQENRDRILVSRGGYDAGYLYECQLPMSSSDTPIDPLSCLPVPDIDDCPVASYRFSPSNERLLLGFQNGILRIHALSQEITKDTLANYYQVQFHDCQTGSLRSINLSYDEKFLITSAQDGTIFCYAIEETPSPDPAVLPPRIMPVSAKPATDIVDPKAYSIEEAKQKLEHDRAVAEAEARKAAARAEIAELRQQFASVIEKNHQLSPELRLERMYFEMEEEIRGETYKTNDEKTDLVQKEMAFEQAKSKLILSRVRDYFYQNLEFDVTMVKSFGSPHFVSTFVLVQPTPTYEEVQNQLEHIRMQSEAIRGPSDARPTASQEEARRAEDLDDRKGLDKDRIVVKVSGSLGERIERALVRVQERRQRRAQRRKEWQELYAAEPGADWQDPADVAAIEYAKLHIGDYKLKSAADYVVPPHLRMNAYKAACRLLLIKEYIHKTKAEFNKEVLGLREIKRVVIADVNACLEELQQVQSRLPSESRKPLKSPLSLSPEEEPEKRFEIKEEIKATTQAVPTDKRAAAQKATKEVPQAHQSLTAQVSEAPIEIKKELTEFEQTQQEEEIIRLEYEQDRLLRHVDKVELEFNARLRVLEYKQNQLNVHVKHASLQEITLFEELMLLKDFEQRERELEGKVEQKMIERTDLSSKVSECQRRMDDKKRDIEKLQEKEGQLTVEFKASISDQTKWGDFLTRVFKKRIKRRKKRDGEEDDDDEEEEEDEDDSEESEEEAGDDDDEDAPVYDLDICPTGCEQNVYDHTVELRERRLDLEEAMTEEKKLLDSIRKELETLQKRSKQTDVGLTSAKNDLEAFQQEKQRRLNALDVIVFLRLHQILHTENNALPVDLENSLVFEEDSVLQLRERIQELRREINTQKLQKEEAKARRLDLELDRRRFERHVATTKSKCDQELKAKFGKKVDIEVLETITINQTVEELRERLRDAEQGWSLERQEFIKSIKDRKSALIESVNNNTTRVQTLNALMQEDSKLVKQLDFNAQRPAAPTAATADAEAERDRARLVDLVQLQAQELESLRMELAALSRKDGHVSPPSQPPPANSLRLKPNF